VAREDCPFYTDGRCVSPGTGRTPPCSFTGTDFARLCAVYPMHRSAQTGTRVATAELLAEATARGLAQSAQTGTRVPTAELLAEATARGLAQEEHPREEGVENCPFYSEGRCSTPLFPSDRDCSFRGTDYRNLCADYVVLAAKLTGAQVPDSELQTEFIRRKLLQRRAPEEPSVERVEPREVSPWHTQEALATLVKDLPASVYGPDVTRRVKAELVQILKPLGRSLDGLTDRGLGLATLAWAVLAAIPAIVFHMRWLAAGLWTLVAAVAVFAGWLWLDNAMVEPKRKAAVDAAAARFSAKFPPGSTEREAAEVALLPAMAGANEAAAALLAALGSEGQVVWSEPSSR